MSRRSAFVLVALLSTALALDAQPAPQARTAVVIRNVTLVDGTGHAPLANVTVVVDGQRIARVTTETVTPPANAQVVEGRGKFLMPGLIDVHVHLAGGGNRASTQPITPQQEQTGTMALHSFLYAGVTTVFDAGNQGSFVFALREKERAGAIVSPRIFATGGTAFGDISMRSSLASLALSIIAVL